MTPPLHRLALGLALALVSSSAIAQTKPEEPATPKDAPATARRPEPFNPFGDTSRFSRLGGWGGMGSGMAQFGMAKATLLMSPAVQKELKLTEAQIKSLRESGDELRKKGEAMFRRQGQGGNGENANQPGEGGPQGGPPNPMAMLEMASTLAREGEAGLAKILDKKQGARLSQIALQMEGVAALAKTEVAEAIYLSPEQVEQIREILNEAKGQQMGLFMRQALNMRGPGGGPPRPGQARPDAAKKDDAEPEDPEAQAKRRQAQRERMQGEFTKFRDSSDQIQDATTFKILRVIDKKQRARFEKLLGEPFDPSKLIPGRPDAAAAESKAAPKGDAAPARSSRLRDARFKGEAKSQP